VTQVGRNGPFADLPDEIIRENWFHHEHYMLAQSTLGWPTDVETDLFAGLR
jgi:hypothetical protein